MYELTEEGRKYLKGGLPEVNLMKELEKERVLKKLKEKVIERLKYVRTCVLARELCLLVRTNRAVLEPKDVHETCLHISDLCKKAGCTEASGLCHKAGEAALANEETYLELCAQSCKKCGEARRPSGKNSSPYVA